MMLLSPETLICLSTMGAGFGSEGCRNRLPFRLQVLHYLNLDRRAILLAVGIEGVLLQFSLSTSTLAEQPVAEGK